MRHDPSATIAWRNSSIPGSRSMVTVDELFVVLGSGLAALTVAVFASVEPACGGHTHYNQHNSAGGLRWSKRPQITNSAGNGAPTPAAGHRATWVAYAVAQRIHYSRRGPARHQEIGPPRWVPIASSMRRRRCSQRPP